jgi:peptidoglycan/LPS O-acetylase OafA/YrhL
MNMVSPDRVSNGPTATLIGDRRQYQTLDGLRGVAALSVVVLHTPHFFGRGHLPYSFLSVDLFFVLSGFVLAAAYEKRLIAGMTAGSFFRIRLIRLFPLYLLGTLLGIPVALMAMKYGGSGISVAWSLRLFMTSLPLSILMLPTPVGTDGFLYPFNPVLWTIFFEIVVNVLYALLAKLLMDTKKLLALVALSATALVVCVLETDTLDGGTIWFTFMVGLSRMMFSFFCGVLICRFRQSRKIRSSVFALALLALLLIILGTPHTNLSGLATILFLFPVMVLMASSVEPGKALQRAFGLLGVTSYAVYAVHKPLYQILLGFLIIVSPVRPESMAPWIGIAYLCLVFAGCIWVDRFYDTPVRQFLSRMQERNRGRTPSGEKIQPTQPGTGAI